MGPLQRKRETLKLQPFSAVSDCPKKAKKHARDDGLLSMVLLRILQSIWVFPSLHTSVCWYTCGYTSPLAL